LNDRGCFGDVSGGCFLDGGRGKWYDDRSRAWGGWRWGGLGLTSDRDDWVVDLWSWRGRDGSADVDGFLADVMSMCGFVCIRSIIILGSFFLEEAEDVVEHEIAVWLFSKEKGLNEFAPRLVVIGHLADDLDDDAAVCRGLGVDGVDEDFAVLEADGGYLVVNFLCGAC
jgi:hypothetical protein